jgi:predicted  nucleic acid-binding Zn-ribbon protein
VASAAPAGAEVTVTQVGSVVATDVEVEVELELDDEDVVLEAGAQSPATVTHVAGSVAPSVDVEVELEIGTQADVLAASSSDTSASAGTGAVKADAISTRATATSSAPSPIRPRARARSIRSRLSAFPRIRPLSWNNAARVGRRTVDPVPAPACRRRCRSLTAMPDPLAPAVAGLLDVQAADNRAEVLRHRLATLPERARLGAAQAAIDALDARAAAEAGPRHELERRQRRLEDEVTSLRTRADEADAALYSGRVSAVRELQALQDEVTSLRRRASELEDQELEVMLELEPMAEAAAAVGVERERLEAEARAATVALAEAEAALEGELREVLAERARAAAAVEARALADYERLRPAFGGSAVVRLVGGRCEGCPLAMPAVEADRIRRSPPGTATCDECGRLVLH